MKNKIDYIKEYIKSNIKLQIYDEKQDSIYVVSQDIEQVLRDYSLNKDTFVFEIDVSEKDFLKIRILMKKIDGYMQIAEKIATMFNRSSIFENNDRVIVFKEKYATKEDLLEDYLPEKISRFFEWNLSPYWDLINLLKSLLLFVS